MKNAPIFLLGLFSALVIAFGGIVLASHAQLGSLTSYFDADGGGVYPERASGVASRGQLVYADLGCAACHTQQVRRPDFGSDQARGWGERQSVARDYIHQIRPQIGASRLGPDLANLAGRKPTAPDADDLFNLLYNGSPTHPSYKFLFDVRETTGERSSQSLKLTGRAAPAVGFEVVPTERARTLVAYLLSLNTGYDYPEARPVAPPAKKAEAAPSKHVEKPIPAAAPDEKKKEAPKK
jgi:cytochrome c oxidase cbb3-type subunit II